MYTNQKINQNALRCYMYLTQYIIIGEISEHDREDIYLDKISKMHQICGSVVSVFNKASLSLYIIMKFLNDLTVITKITK